MRESPLSITDMPRLVKIVLVWLLLAFLASLPAVVLLIQEFSIPEAVASGVLFFIPLGALRWLRFLPRLHERAGLPIASAVALSGMEIAARAAMRSRVAVIFALPLVPLAIWVNACNFFARPVGQSPERPGTVHYRAERGWGRDVWIGFGVALAIDVGIVAAVLPEALRQRRRLSDFAAQERALPIEAAEASA